MWVKGQISGGQKVGVIVLLLLIIGMQLVYFFVDFSSEMPLMKTSVAIDFQAKVDSLKLKALEDQRPKRYPFNPNFITDYKGYTLGMSIAEIDRLHNFRKTNKYVNSAKEFQQVTKVSDSLLNELSPYFKFPDWVVKRERSKADSRNKFKQRKISAPVEKIDLNLATAEELRKIRGIGEKTAARIIKYREILGGYSLDEQLYEVYYLDPQVAAVALERFTVRTPPKIPKIDINMATTAQMAKIHYLDYRLASKIVTYRSEVGNITSLDELTKIEDFPTEKINRIALYLTIK